MFIQGMMLSFFMVLKLFDLFIVISHFKKGQSFFLVCYTSYGLHREKTCPRVFSPSSGSLASLLLFHILKRVDLSSLSAT